MNEENKNELELETTETVNTAEDTLNETTETAESTSEAVNEAIDTTEADDANDDAYIISDAVLEANDDTEEIIIDISSKTNSKVKIAIAAVVAIVVVILAVVAVKLLPSFYNKYNAEGKKLGYVNTSGRTIDTVADEFGMSVEEFLEQYDLPADMPGNTEETTAFYNIPFSKFAEMNGYEIEDFKENFGLSDDITEDMTWGEVESQITLAKYVGEEYLDAFKEQYELGDDVTGETTWGEIRKTIAEYELRMAEEAKASSEAEATAEAESNESADNAETADVTENSGNVEVNADAAVSAE